MLCATTLAVEGGSMFLQMALFTLHGSYIHLMFETLLSNDF